MHLPASPVLTSPHRRSAAAVLGDVGSHPTDGLTTPEAAARLARIGPNELAEAERTPAWRRFVAQFGDRLILILLAAAAVAFVASGELKTPIVVVVVVVLNAVIGFVQEHRAERSLDALRRMLVHRARVRRDGGIVSVESRQLVPGDVVLVEAGDRVPADGRLLFANRLEVDESSLTGESQPVAKQTDPVAAADGEPLAVGDRACMAHMNTTVTRGRGELVVTATGMHTEIGRVAGLLAGRGTERSPLERQLDRLARSLAALAGVIVAAAFAIGLLRGEPIDELLLTAVALAVAAIPEGLPAVTAVTLALGVAKMARQNAIVKRLAAVETLGSTNVICSDKTGTLTLNEMTVVEVVTSSGGHAVSGRGYSPDGAIAPADGGDAVAVEAVVVGGALCNDAVVRRSGEEWELVGDPTEGALVVLAMKAGIDVAALRARRPRLVEVPFDAANKFMATAHAADASAAAATVRVYVKGAADVLIARATSVIGRHGELEPIDEVADHWRGVIDELAGRGLRVLAVAQRDVAADAVDEHDLLSLVDRLTICGLVGIVDPPRPEAARAIAEAQGAGIDVKMITGDHAATATSIAAQLGLHGGVVTGAELDRLDDSELTARMEATSVFARVAPEHKLRLVELMQQRGDVVAMTGDGVNDAPALKRADIGVAMGITGTEVSKEAATTVLTDDNFATIVGAVRLGRGIYDNIVAFVRFQLSTTLGFATLFLLAGLIGIADGKPFTAIAILWVNLVVDGPPAMALGLDPPASDVMRRRPRPVGEPILTGRRWVAVAFAAAVMSAGTLVVLAWAPGDPTAGTATVAGTMAFNTFVMFQLFNLLNARSDRGSVLSGDTLRNRWLWLAIAAVVALQLAVTHTGPLQRLFDTTSISAWQWAICAVVASAVLWLEELRKFTIRQRTKELVP